MSIPDDFSPRIYHSIRLRHFKRNSNLPLPHSIAVYDHLFSPRFRNFLVFPQINCLSGPFLVSARDRQAANSSSEHNCSVSLRVFGVDVHLNPRFFDISNQNTPLPVPRRSTHQSFAPFPFLFRDTRRFCSGPTARNRVRPKQKTTHKHPVPLLPGRGARIECDNKKNTYAHSNGNQYRVCERVIKAAMNHGRFGKFLRGRRR